MIISIAKGALQNVLATVGKRADQSTPHLACIHIEASDGSAVFSATNLNESARSVESVLVEANGECLIPVKRLSEIVKSLPDAAVTIEANSSSASITCGKAKFHIPALDPEDFPGTIAFNAENSARIGFCYFCDMVRKCESFAAKDDSNPVLSGILFDADGSTLRMVATDSYRMICCELKSDAEFRVVIPAKFAASVASMKASSGSVSIAYDDSFVMIENDDCILATRRIEGNYPAWQRLIPQSFESTAKFNKGEVYGAVRRAATLGNSVPVQFEYNPNGARVSADAGDNGSMSEDVTCITTGEAAIKVNAAFASEAINAIGGSEVTMGFNGSFKPLYLSSGSCYGIVMPMR